MNRKTFLCCLCLSAVATAAFAAERLRPPPMSAAEIANNIPDGARIETRLDADVTGDGMPDTIFVAASDDRRVLKVMIAYVDEFDTGYQPVGEVEMDVDPLGAASLSVKKGVLLVEDLTGGTTAIQSLYRYRFDTKARRMRLIGDDVTLYSRTKPTIRPSSAPIASPARARPRCRRSRATATSTSRRSRARSRPSRCIWKTRRCRQIRWASAGDQSPYSTATMKNRCGPSGSCASKSSSMRFFSIARASGESMLIQPSFASVSSGPTMR